jgi:hypothetical protein
MFHFGNVGSIKVKDVVSTGEPSGVQLGFSPVASHLSTRKFESKCCVKPALDVSYAGRLHQLARATGGALEGFGSWLQLPPARGRRATILFT